MGRRKMLVRVSRSRSGAEPSPLPRGQQKNPVPFATPGLDDSSRDWAECHKRKQRAGLAFARMSAKRATTRRSVMKLARNTNMVSAP